MKLTCIVSGICMMLLLFSCTKQDAPADNEAIPADVLQKLEAQGYSTQHVIKWKDGYLVEGDIYLPVAQINRNDSSTLIRIANTEQYRTTNLITGLPRVLTVSVTNLPAAYTDATDVAIARYNALNLRLTFQRVATNGAIDIQSGSFSDPDILGQSAGFPDASGNPPAGSILLNVSNLGSNPDQGYLATVIAHEIGHCIGFRHSDYFNRAYSCLYVSPQNNEGSAGIGAINIPGTPATEDPNSWMLACSDGSDRPFNGYDVIALRYLYGPIQCSGADKKMINGVCEKGVKVITNMQNVGTASNPRCRITYHYEWSDSSSSPHDLYETLVGNCML